MELCLIQPDPLDVPGGSGIVLNYMLCICIQCRYNNHTQDI